MHDLKLVIFDCDGVMFDSREANRVYYNQMLAHFGHPPMDAAELDYVHVHHVMASVGHIFRHYPDDIEAAHAFRKALDYTPFLQHMLMEPDLVEFLAYLRPARKTAISTNRTTTMPAILEMFHLAPLFDKVVTAIDVARPKPHPEAIHQILDHFGMQAHEAIYIGDSEVDQEHAHSAGMRLIAFKNPALAADYHVECFMEITKLPIF
ncbi:MAG TPA: HAD family hydrolase [Desulfurivibrionaceae bacterium]|nr:HAD family hydrolase [Desulfurivibrionaceae bacterium]